jgi:FMN phosphatase YigB (HAD superfamily)
MALTAVGFDLDGTLYPNHRFWVRLLPFLARGMPLLLSMGKARDKLRAGGHDGHFYSVQAELASRHLKRPAHEVRELIDEKIYRGWEPLFSRVRPRRGVREEVLALKAAGLKVGILSDFPIGNKLDLLGLGGIWDALVCSEEVGKLKPAPEPFLALAAALGADPEDMAYVGNSLRHRRLRRRGHATDPHRLEGIEKLGSAHRGAKLQGPSRAHPGPCRSSFFPRLIFRHRPIHGPPSIGFPASRR